MKHTIKHDVENNGTVKKVVDLALQEYAERYPNYKPTLTWVNDRKATLALSVFGMKIDGGFAISKGKIEVDLNVPSFLSSFQPQAMKTIEDEVEKWLSKVKNGEIS